MTKHVFPPLETRSEPEDDPLAQATRAVEELRTAAEEARTRHAEEIRQATDRIAALETRLNRPGHQQQRQEGGELEMRAFSKVLRNQQALLTPEETRALTATTGTTGENLIPQTFISEVLKDLAVYSPIRNYARVMSISSSDITLPKRLTKIAPGHVTEIGARPSSNPTYGQVKITPHEIAVKVPVSQQLFEDSAINLASEITGDTAEAFAEFENWDFVNGDGDDKAFGILSNADIEVINSGSAADLGKNPVDLLTDAYFKLKPAYRKNAVWGMAGSTIASLKKLKDTTGQYIWQPNVIVGQPATILGLPVIEMSEMPAVAANSLPVFLGDLKQGYRIVDRISLAYLFDQTSLADNGQVLFRFRRRVGGDVVKAEALKLIKVAG